MATVASAAVRAARAAKKTFSPEIEGLLNQLRGLCAAHNKTKSVQQRAPLRTMIAEVRAKLAVLDPENETGAVLATTEPTGGVHGRSPSLEAGVTVGEALDRLIVRFETTQDSENRRDIVNALAFVRGATTSVAGDML